MVFFFLCFTVFIMFFQPVFVFPQLESFQPLRNCAMLSLLFYLFSSKKVTCSIFSNKGNIYYAFFVIFQVASAFQIWWIGAVEVMNYWLKIGIVYFLIIKNCTSLNRVLWICAIIGLSVAYLSFYSYSLFIVNYIPGQRAAGFGWYENPNDLAIILVSVIPLLLLVSNQLQFWIGKSFFIILAAAYAGNILFTASRNGLLGLTGAGLLSIYFSRVIPRTIRVLLIVILSAGVLGIGIVNVMHREDGVAGLRGDGSSEDRIIQWKAAARMVVAHPLLGVGPGEFLSNAADFGGVRGLEPHNTIVQVFAETGIFAGTFFLLFGLFPVFKTLGTMKYERLSSSRMALIFVNISLTGFWICAFFSNRYQFYILYVLVALSMAINENIIKNELSDA